MWLQYGVDSDGALVSIDDVPRGKNNLKCPYCQGGLTAKKGKIKEHHFAHTEETCRFVERSTDIPTLPLFDKFNLELTGKELEALKKFWHGGHVYSSMLRQARDCWNGTPTKAGLGGMSLPSWVKFLWVNYHYSYLTKFRNR